MNGKFLYRCENCREWTDSDDPAAIFCKRCDLGGEHRALILVAVDVVKFYREQMDDGFHVCPNSDLLCTSRVWSTADDYGKGVYVTISHVSDYTWSCRLHRQDGTVIFDADHEVWK